MSMLCQCHVNAMFLLWWCLVNAGCGIAMSRLFSNVSVQYHGHVSDMLLPCHGATAMPRQYHVNAMSMPHPTICATSPPICACCVLRCLLLLLLLLFALSVPRQRRANAMTMPGRCHVGFHAGAMSWLCHVSATSIPCQCHVSAVSVGPGATSMPCQCHIMPCQCHVNAMFMPISATLCLVMAIAATTIPCQCQVNATSMPCQCHVNATLCHMNAMSVPCLCQLVPHDAL